MPETFWASSIYGAMHDKPLVQLSYGPDFKIQISPKEARAIAYSILEAAECSETDAFVVRFFRAKIGLNMEQATRILQDFREARNQLDKEQPPPEQGRG